MSLLVSLYMALITLYVITGENNPTPYVTGKKLALPYAWFIL